MNRILTLLLLLAATTANAAVSIAESTVVTLLRGTSSQGTFPSWDACRINMMIINIKHYS